MDFTTAVIDTTYRCNDNCAFCFNQRFINQSPDISLAEIKRKYREANRKWKITQVILSGGEPTLNPEFWEMMDFFYNHTKSSTSLNTNSLRFNDADFSAQMVTFLQKVRKKSKMFALSLSSVDHFPGKTLKEKLKLSGVAKGLAIAAASEVGVMVIIIVTKTNYKILPQLVNFIAQNAKQKIQLQLRGLYLDGMMNPQQEMKLVPRSFAELRPYIEKAMEIALDCPDIQPLLFSIPLCYFHDWPRLSELMRQVLPLPRERRIKIKEGKEPTARLFQEATWSRPECKGCILDSRCNKIQKDFLEKYDYPKLIPLRRFALVSAHVVPTYGCNLACSYCYASKFKGIFPQMSWAKFTTLLDKLITNNVGRIIFAGGEPTTWKFLPQAIEVAKSLGMEVVVLTNAVLRMTKLPHAITVNGNNLADAKLREKILANLKYYRERGVRIGLRFNLDTKTTPALMKQYATYARDYADEVSISPIVPYTLSKKLGKILYDFAKLIEKNKQKATFSRAIPICIFTPAQLRYLREKCGFYSICSPATTSLTFNPDATVLPCVDLKIPKKAKQDLRENCKEYVAPLTKLKNKPVFAACKKCKHFRVDCQGGCLSMKCAA